MLLKFKKKSKAFFKKPSTPEEEQGELVYGMRGTWHTLVTRACSKGVAALAWGELVEGPREQELSHKTAPYIYHILTYDKTHIANQWEWVM